MTAITILRGLFNMDFQTVLHNLNIVKVLIVFNVRQDTLIRTQPSFVR